VALSETLLHYPDLRQELEQMGPIEFLEEGIYKLRDHCYMGNWLAKAGLYILGEILINKGDLAHGEPAYWFEETEPEHIVESCQVDKQKNSVRLRINIGDEDKATVVKTFYTDWDYRDWVQLGFDWDGDENIDEWTKLFNRDKKTLICLVIKNHRWGEGTEHATIGLVSRDNWGVRGKYETLQISFERNVDFPKGIFFIGRCPFTNAPHGPHIASNYDLIITHTGTTRFGFSLEDFETGDTSVDYWDKRNNEEKTIYIDGFSGFLTHRTLLRFVVGWGTCTDVTITTQKILEIN
jgi:hypothetical protein